MRRPPTTAKNSPRRWCLLTSTVGVVILASCSPTPKNEESPTDLGVRQDRAPLQRLVSPPRRPPKLVLIENEYSRQTGTLLNLNWGTRRDVTTPREILWPKPLPVARADGLRLLIPTDAFPRTITLTGFSQELRGNGAPQSPALFRIECTMHQLQFSQGRCATRPHEDGHVLIFDLLGAVRLAANVTWVSSPNGGDVEILTGTWLFSLRAD